VDEVVDSRPTTGEDATRGWESTRVLRVRRWPSFSAPTPWCG